MKDLIDPYSPELMETFERAYTATEIGKDILQSGGGRWANDPWFLRDFLIYGTITENGTIVKITDIPDEELREGVVSALIADADNKNLVYLVGLAELTDIIPKEKLLGEVMKRYNTDPNFTEELDSSDLNQISMLASNTGAKRLESNFIGESVKRRWEETKEYVSTTKVYSALKTTAENCYNAEETIKKHLRDVCARPHNEKELEKIMSGLERFLVEYGNIPALADPVKKAYRELQQRYREMKFGKIGEIINKLEGVVYSAVSR